MTTIPLSEAAGRLGIHPTNLMLKVLPLIGDELTYCWPDIEEGVVETIKTMKGIEVIDDPKPPSRTIVEPDTHKSTDTSSDLPVSESAAGVLDKLTRKGFWGRKGVSLDTVRNNICRNIDNVDNAISELVDRGLFVQRKGNEYSLDSQKKGEIEEIVECFRKP